MTKRVWLRGGRGALYIGSLIFYWYGTASGMGQQVYMYTLVILLIQFKIFF